MEKYFAAIPEEDVEISPHFPMELLDSPKNEDNFQIVLMAFDLEECIEVRNLVNLGILLQELGHDISFVACKYNVETAPSELQMFPVITVTIGSYMIRFYTIGESLKCRPLLRMVTYLFTIS